MGNISQVRATAMNLDRPARGLRLLGGQFGDLAFVDLFVFLDAKAWLTRQKTVEKRGHGKPRALRINSLSTSVFLTSELKTSDAVK